MNFAEKAAAFLIAIGPDAAAEIYRHLDEKTMLRISAEMARIDRLDPSERDDLIGEFINGIRNSRGTIYGGEEFARTFLTESIGAEKASTIIRKLELRNLDDTFEFLREAEPEVIRDLIKAESPQTCAVVIAKLGGERAAAVLKIMDRSLARETAVRLAKMKKISPEALLELSRILRKRFEAMNATAVAPASAGGTEALMRILNHVDGGSENRILSKLDETLPTQAREIRERIYSFESVVTLANAEIRILIDEINDDRLIALALKGAGDDVRFRMLRNMSNNRATDVLTEIERMGPKRITEILEARQKIVGIMKRLNENGSIILKKNAEPMIE